MYHLLRGKILLWSKNGALNRFSAYMLAGILNKALPFFLLPVLTTYLSPEEYGTLALYQVLISFFVPIIGMNMQANITRHFFRKSREEIAHIIFTICLILVSVFVIVLFLFVPILGFFPAIVDLPLIWICTIPVVAASMIVKQFNLTVLRNQERAKLYGMFEVSATVINLFITIVLVVFFEMGWQGRAAGVFFAPLIIGIVGMIRLYRSKFIIPIFDREIFRNILKVSFPLIPHALSMVVISLSDRFFLDHMLGKEAVGIYTVGYQFGMIVAISTDSFSKAWSPWMYKQLADLNSQQLKRVVQYTYFYDIGVLIFAIVVTFSSYILIEFMTTEAYFGAKQFVIWIAVSYAIRGMYLMRFPYLIHEGKTGFLAIMTTTSAIINLIANYFLILHYGALGAAQATLLSFLIQFVGIWWYANKIHPMPWFSKALVKRG
ncbi:MAG: hypothetical protein DWQ04_14290 [Chloroflexi bacterium]|nr:MAG: hypothetical protein DWQ04_14290 [Chloroflexota bacterium]